LDLPHYPETGLGGLWQWRDELYTTTIPRSILIFCDTENTRQTLVSRYRAYPDRVRVIGLLPSVPEQVEPEKLDKEHFIYPSMFWPHKNHTTLIDAFKKFIEEHGEVAYLVLTGEGRLRSAIEKVAQDSGISHLIRFEGLVTRSRLMSLIAGSRGLLMPSLLGPSNIPPLEAVLLGIPVAVSDAHSMETMLGQLEIVKGKSVQGWSRSFRKLYYREIEVPSILPLHESKTLASALTDLSDALIDSRLSEL
jgi:glycosyltransferase involved in cell wall biosynthesis